MGQCCFHCSYEFQLKKFGFEDVHSERFSMFQWRLPPILYLLYRITVAVYADFWLFYTAFDYMHMMNSTKTEKNNTYINPYAWPVYLTNWTYTALCLYLTVHAILSIYCLCHRKKNLCKPLSIEMHRSLFKELEVHPSLWGSGDSYERLPGNDGPEQDGDIEVGEVSFRSRSRSLPWYCKAIWILLNVVSSAAVMVTVVFFIFLWPQVHPKDGSIDLDNLQLHGINSVIIFIEHSVTAVPVNLLHFIYPFIYGIIYIVFSAIFYGAGNKDPIYPEVLDWNHGKEGPTLMMIVLIGFVIIPLLQVLFFILYKIRICIFNKLCDG